MSGKIEQLREELSYKHLVVVLLIVALLIGSVVVLTGDNQDPAPEPTPEPEKSTPTVENIDTGETYTSLEAGVQDAESSQTLELLNSQTYTVEEIDKGVNIRGNESLETRPTLTSDTSAEYTYIRDTETVENAVVVSNATTNMTISNVEMGNLVVRPLVTPDNDAVKVTIEDSNEIEGGSTLVYTGDQTDILISSSDFGDSEVVMDNTDAQSNPRDMYDFGTDDISNSTVNRVVVHTTSVSVVNGSEVGQIVYDAELNPDAQRENGADQVLWNIMVTDSTVTGIDGFSIVTNAEPVSTRTHSSDNGYYIRNSTINQTVDTGIYSEYDSKTVVVDGESVFTCDNDTEPFVEPDLYGMEDTTWRTYDISHNADICGL